MGDGQDPGEFCLKFTVCSPRLQNAEEAVSDENITDIIQEGVSQWCYLHQTRLHNRADCPAKQNIRRRQQGTQP